jgi:putative DNA primase/helicase
MKHKKLEYTLTDTGNAERLYRDYGSVIRYHKSLGWLFWTGKYWKLDEGGVKLLARKTAKSIYIEAAESQDEGLTDKLSKWAKESLSLYRINAMVEGCKPMVEIDVSQLDKHPHLLNVRNGMIDLTNGKLLKHDKSKYLTKYLDIEYDLNAKPPTKWLKFIKFLFTSKEMQVFIQKAIGYSLTGFIDEQCLFFLLGDGANGKSTFIEAISQLLGDYGLKSHIEILMEAKPGSLTPHLDKFNGIRFVSCSEIKRGGRFNTDAVKNLTGGDAISVNPKYRDVYTFNPTHKLWIFGNSKPSVSETNHAFWRRIRLIEFDKIIEQMRKMSEILHEFNLERAAILTWAVQGELLRLKEGMEQPKEMQEAVKEYREDEDIFLRFANERLEFGASYREATDNVWNDFIKFANSFDGVSVGKRYIGNRLAERNIKCGGAGKRFYIGVKLRPSDIDVINEALPQVKPKRIKKKQGFS